MIMKKVLLLAIAISLVVAGIAVAGVLSSKHDMRLEVTNETTTQVCVYCHHPHRGSQSGFNGTLLWNFQDTGNAFTTYGSASMTGTTVGDLLTTSANSTAIYTLYCMACHDGGFTDDSLVRAPLGSSAGTLTTMTVSSANNLNDSDSLMNDHPVDFTVVATDGGIQAPASSSGYIDGATTTTVNYPLYSGTMQCATCHNVHNGSHSGAVQFLRGTSADLLNNSDMCTDCHTNK